MSDTIRQEEWSFAYGPPEASGTLRSVPEDFVVEEQLGFEPDGAGEHLLLQVRKRGANTDFVARQLARLAGLPEREVGYCGLKDRHAVTTQWFSIPMGKRAVPEWDGLPEGVVVLRAERHGRKLRRGAHTANRFRITVRLREGEADIEERLRLVARRGVPNYFGEQRFGRDDGNLARALALFDGTLRERDRHKRSLYLSSARSFLFNRVLSARVTNGSWDQLLPGECCSLAGSRSFFLAEAVDEPLMERLASGDIHPSGPLWGEGELPCRGEAAEVEGAALGPYRTICEGLARSGLEQERRALRLLTPDLAWELKGEQLVVEFTLPPGAYATSLLREVVSTNLSKEESPVAPAIAT